jgi:cell wall-associated NlpC family hydrolase
MIPAWVGSYIGLPFKDRGRDRGGLDCWGLVWMVKREQFGEEIPSYSGDYADASDREEIGRLIRDEVNMRWRRLTDAEVRIGEVILLRRESEPGHVGIIVDLEPRAFLHVHVGADAYTARCGAIMWRNRILGFYRYVG